MNKCAQTICQRLVEYTRVCEELTCLHRHGIELLEDVAEVGLVDLVTPHGEVVEVEDGGPVLQ